MSVQLLTYQFGPGADFGGGLVGALERLESGGALRVVDALFVRRDAETGELVAIEAHGRGMGATLSRLLAFRLDAAARQRETERALSDRQDVRAVADTLEPGAALAAVLVEHVWAEALEDAIARTGGSPVRNEFVDATALDELTSLLVTAERG